jgi:hypothetical protein
MLAMVSIATNVATVRRRHDSRLTDPPLLQRQREGAFMQLPYKLDNHPASF